MRATAAAFDGAASFNGLTVSSGALRRVARVLGGHIVTAIAAVAAVGALAIIVTMAAVWIVSSGLVTKPDIYAKAPAGPGTLALASLEPVPRSAVPHLPQIVEVPESRAKSAIAQAPIAARVARLDVAAPPSVAPRATTLAPRISHESASPVPLPRAHPVQMAMARAPAKPPASQVQEPPRQVAAATLKPPATTVETRVAAQEPRKQPAALADADSRTAVYDISARTVYLPNGERLEAHSGLYDKLDDPRYVNVKMRGPTPPNVYELTLREQLFHGVRAIRLNPVDEGKMYGRAGMLAHTYMLGPNGQSNGCVSFRDYDKFLEAFLRGEIDRLVVVPEGGTKLALGTRTRRGRADRYADNNPMASSNPNTW